MPARNERASLLLGAMSSSPPEQALYMNRLMQTEGICAIEGDNECAVAAIGGVEDDDDVGEEDEDEVEDPVQTLKRPNQQAMNGPFPHTTMFQ